VSPKATPDEIDKAFRRLALELHPDLNDSDPNAKKKFQIVQRAASVLRDPKSREAYDLEVMASGGVSSQVPDTTRAGERSHRRTHSTVTRKSTATSPSRMEWVDVVCIFVGLAVVIWAIAHHRDNSEPARDPARANDEFRAELAHSIDSLPRDGSETADEIRRRRQDAIRRMMEEAEQNEFQTAPNQAREGVEPYAERDDRTPSPVPPLPVDPRAEQDDGTQSPMDHWNRDLRTKMEPPREDREIGSATDDLMRDEQWGQMVERGTGEVVDKRASSSMKEWWEGYEGINDFDDLILGIQQNLFRRSAEELMQNSLLRENLRTIAVQSGSMVAAPAARMLGAPDLAGAIHRANEAVQRQMVVRDKEGPIPPGVAQVIRTVVSVLPAAGIFILVLFRVFRVTPPKVSPKPEGRVLTTSNCMAVLLAAVVLGTIVFETQAVLRLFLSANR
jgi:curved DNA-binding protein CbpA